MSSPRGTVPIALGGQHLDMRFTLDSFYWLKEQGIDLTAIRVMLDQGGATLDQLPTMLAASFRHMKEKAPAVDEVSVWARQCLPSDLQLPLMEALAYAMAPDPKEAARVEAIVRELFPNSILPAPDAGTLPKSREPPSPSAGESVGES